LVKIVSIIGGIAGGWMTQQVVGHVDVGSITVLTTIAGSFVTGGFLGGAVRLIAGGKGSAPAST
jgi:hypothetical protein